MFKRYELRWPDSENTVAKTTFYVHRKARRNGGFIHRAIAVGAIPRLDSSTPDYAQYQKNNDKLEKMRRAKAVAIPGGKLCLERWQGKHVLCKLWEQLAELPFTDMMAIGYNPFDSDEEPDHDDLVEPEDVFG